MASEPVTGWLRDEEDYDYLHNQGVVFSVQPLLYGAPDEFDADPIITTENQSAMSSCTGHGESSGIEGCFWIAAGGDKSNRPKQFSRMFAYIEGQRESGFIGRDQGASIAGVVQASAKVGCCLESTYPYPSRYTTSIPQGAYAEAAKYKIRSHSNLRSYEEIMAYQQSGLGPIVIGITWTSALANSTGVISVRDTKGRGGGHCVLLWGWDKNGRIRLHNSHGTAWGQNGKAWVEVDAVKSWLSSGSAEFIGISDLSGVDVQRPMVCDYGDGL